MDALKKVEQRKGLRLYSPEYYGACMVGGLLGELRDVKEFFANLL